MKPKLLFYCQHSVGIGHLMRSLLLARSLSEQFQITFLNGGPLPSGIEMPPSIARIDLPPLGMKDGHTLIARAETMNVDEAKRQRRALILEAWARCAPEVLLIELFPFGRKKFAFELLPLLKATRRSARPPLTLCSLRDILIGARPDQLHHDNRAAWLCRRYFDGVLVHADPRVARLEESFQPRLPFTTPTFYTGFVAAPTATQPTERAAHILVSAGGGLVGGPLFGMALQAHALLPRTDRPPLRLIAGPFLPENEWHALQRLCAGSRDVELVRSVPSMEHEMRRAALSISQCGYNTAMDILNAGTPALVIPYCEGREDEQVNRAHRLQGLGVLRMLDPRTASAAQLADAMVHRRGLPVTAHALDLTGAARTAGMVADLLAAQRRAAPQAHRHVA